MEPISRAVLTFVLNCCWQTALAAGVAALVCRLMRRGPASHTYAVWVAALVIGVSLPLASLRSPEAGPAPRYDPSSILANSGASGAGSAVPSSGVQTATASVVTYPAVSLARTTGLVLLGAYLLFLLFRLAVLARAWSRTAAIRSAAFPFEASPLLAAVWKRCAAVFQVNDAELLYSPTVSGPVTAGVWRRTIILPEHMRAEQREDVLLTAIGHEMAHVMRRDFAWKLLLEALHALVSFHPAAWLMRREIERAREMSCDELVTSRLMDSDAYARSVVRIAAGMTGVPEASYALGVLDGDILESRIKRLIERPAANLKRARVLLGTGLAALGLCALIASGLAVSARAQSPAEAEVKAGAEAYRRGDFLAAVRHLETAVVLEPSNISSRLLLGRYYQWAGKGSADSPLLARAAEQYRAVLAQQPDQTEAIAQIMGIATVTKQWAEARRWAKRLAEVNPNSKGAYYTEGFIAWAEAYPAIIAAPGMRREEYFIPDQVVRAGLRVQWAPTLDEGIRMLQTALQIDPDYADALAYLNLLYRLKAAVSDSPNESAGFLAQADEWVGKALAAKMKERAAKQNLPPGEWPPETGAPPPPPPPPAPTAKFSVVGEVLHPGSYTRNSPTRILEALAMAGGFSQYADPTQIIITRRGGDRLRINYTELVTGKNIEQNVLLEPEDVIVVK